MIPVDRDKGPAALRAMLRETRKRVVDGREIIIFPEGTRRPPGAPPDYKTGVVLLYEALGLPCVPVALNSGLFWPRRSLLGRPGNIVDQFPAPIPPRPTQHRFPGRPNESKRAPPDPPLGRGKSQGTSQFCRR